MKLYIDGMKEPDGDAAHVYLDHEERDGCVSLRVQRKGGHSYYVATLSPEGHLTVHGCIDGTGLRTEKDGCIVVERETP